MSLSNVDIDNFAKRNKIKNYIGCFSKDMLPHRRLTGFYVINMEDNDAGNGTHWVLTQEKNGGSIYMDSFAVPPPLDVLNYFTHPMETLSHQLQDLDSDRCGYFCQYYMKQLSLGRSMDDIIQDFDIHDLKKNDEIV